MYTISLLFTDGTKYMERSEDGSDLNVRSIAFSLNKSIEESWVEDEAGNVVSHYNASTSFRMSKHEDEECEADEDDGQPTEYQEWQDYMGGDDWDHGQYDC